MIILQTHQLSKSYGGTPILSNINIEIQSGDRVGLVGVNGAGKSTLLQIIVGQIPYDEGDIFKSKSTSIGYLAQDSGLESNHTIWDEMLSVFADLIKEENRLRQLEQKMSEPSVIENESLYEELLSNYSKASQAFEDKGGYQYEALIRNVLHGLRFAEKDYSDKIGTLSGGQKTRLALAKLLLQKPDLLVLDEPTNYLDLDTLAWLENYLLSYPGALLIVSHDRYFLDALTNIIYEIERSRATKYVGNYSKFLQLKEEALAQQQKSYEKQQKEIKQLEDFVQRNIARASTSNRAKSRRKRLEKIDRVDRPDGPLKSAQFSFDIARKSGNDVLKVEDVAIGYEKNEPLSQHINFQAYRGDSIAIVGPNGIGKTTLLKSIIGHLPLVDGSIQKGTNVHISYYDQEQHALHAHKTVLAEIWDDYPHMLEKEVRSLLGLFLFSGEDVDKKVSGLSGGEKARLSLAKLMLEKGNLLILDEPTNHLDVYSKEVLEQSLIDYPGTIIFVSHDRYFLNRIATKVMELGPNGATMYLGDYDYYVEKKREQHEIEQLQQKKIEKQKRDAIHSDKKVYEQEKERQRELRKKERHKQALEQKIEQLEQDIQALEEQLFSPEVYEDYEKAHDVQEQINHHKQTLDELIEELIMLEELEEEQKE